QRLNRVELKHSGTLVKRYQLSYEESLSPLSKHSRLQKVFECGINDSGVQGCYAPIEFEWTDASSAHSIQPVWVAESVRWLDIDGDGLDDMVSHGGLVPDENPNPYD